MNETPQLSRYLEGLTLLTRFDGLWPELAQLMAGFATDTESWGEWDESVRTRAMKLATEIHGYIERGAGQVSREREK